MSASSMPGVGRKRPPPNASSSHAKLSSSFGPIVVAAISYPSSSHCWCLLKKPWKCIMESNLSEYHAPMLKGPTP